MNLIQQFFAQELNQWFKENPKIKEFVRSDPAYFEDDETLIIDVMKFNYQYRDKYFYNGVFEKNAVLLANKIVEVLTERMQQTGLNQFYLHVKIEHYKQQYDKRTTLRYQGEARY